MTLQEKIEKILSENYRRHAFALPEHQKKATKDLLALFQDEQEAISDSLKDANIHIKNCRCSGNDLNIKCYLRCIAIREIIRTHPTP